MLHIVIRKWNGLSQQKSAAIIIIGDHFIPQRIADGSETKVGRESKESGYVGEIAYEFHGRK